MHFFQVVAEKMLKLYRIQSATLGLPAMLWKPSSQSVVPLPLPIDDKYLSTEFDVQNVQPIGRPSKLHFFRHALMLSNIFTDIMMEYYNTDIDCEPARDDERHPKQLRHISVVTYENRMTTFWNSLPNHLRPAKSDQPAITGDTDRLFRYQAAVLRARYAVKFAFSEILRSLLTGFSIRAYSYFDQCLLNLCPRLKVEG
jgi:hypothetical protein